MDTEQKKGVTLVTLVHQIVYGLLLASVLMLIPVVSIFGYRLFGFVGLWGSIAYIVVVGGVGGFLAYKRRHVSTFGRVMRGEPIE